ncbi:hypothetical protein UFOVP1290_495 [uncultured Caudovirales phage]|uniref:Uncharacterized protein n=1 Tax=uncultured Caudovirales phage TaxID=2100421 RepID=A0A6J5RXJ7_9CAUD|nr:hypothetical protein UFOVP1290_495 [uncultured Caudovirales phage]
MKLSEKLGQLKLAAKRMSAISELYPNADIIIDDRTSCHLWCSDNLDFNALNTEFSINHCADYVQHRVFIYNDVSLFIEDKQETIRIYSNPPFFNLFEMHPALGKSAYMSFNSYLKCNDYINELNSFDSDIIKSCNLYVINYIKENNISKMINLPITIQNLLAFL